MTERAALVLFVLGEDYHLGDLLWFTSVVAAYRRQRAPASVTVSLPDRGISRILESNPHIDELHYRPVGEHVAGLGESSVVHDLRLVPIAIGMLRHWRRRWPWLYYRDLWLKPRGDWLGTYLGLRGPVAGRPVLVLDEEDRRAAAQLTAPYVVLAPHIGQYRWAPLRYLWQRIKGWDSENWRNLAIRLRERGLASVTLAAADQTAVPGTVPLLGLPIRQAAAVIEGAAGLIGGESGLWFLAAASGVPFVIVPWWLPPSVDWAAPMDTPYRLIRRQEATVDRVVDAFGQIV